MSTLRRLFAQRIKFSFLEFLRVSALADNTLFCDPEGAMKRLADHYATK
jgi:hypothetical protein